MKSIVAAIAVFAVSLVSAQTVPILSPTSPIIGTKYTAGQPAIINWIDPKVDIITAINLLKGDKNALTFITTIASNVDAKAMTYTWDVPATLAPGVDYALGFGPSPDTVYSGFFTILSATGSAGNATTPAPTSSVKAATSSTKAATNTAKASTTTSAKPTQTEESAANKNMISLGAIAAGAVVAAMIKVSY
ncbi:hypothetical protein BDB01DRAFT_848820 [Pilobolus umbonatus]|nr:hypothetical protein BDB01DRAFT_848820 [Pilobolus umbonatus]